MDFKKCGHGISYSDDCDRCEIISLKDYLERAEPRVRKDRKRLDELQRKISEQETLK